ncbi:MAG: hypothetical protein IJ762_13045 [Bacteroidaceae bacterium]|nr:hypothetical protein [Bacteroidaceae bacterium]MBR1790083.1 hypothetical protein [Bacteroidaceae bacterium]
MNKFLIRFFLVASLLCGILGSSAGARTQGLSTHCGHENEEQIRPSEGWLRQVAEEPQSLGGTVLRTVPSPHRVASYRHSRLLPRHGGKPTNHNGRWAKGKPFNPTTFPSLLPFRCDCRQRAAAASPRLIYVIALRRLLC